MPNKPDRPGKPGMKIRPPMERFMAFVVSGYGGTSIVGSECWLWSGALLKGYGQFQEGSKCVLAHRFLWEKTNGPIPDGMQLDHLCRNPMCVSPTHLEPVTARVNTARSTSKAAPMAATGICQRGHDTKVTGVYVTPSTGKSACKACLYAHNLRRQRERPDEYAAYRASRRAAIRAGTWTFRQKAVTS